ncbi:MAG: hypothetical protein Ta2D_08160 [Rickettsiales bacterium]|nr:MAG: hypothetical protein Ta2D_08160 [Rickettsiales bacterium]
MPNDLIISDIQSNYKLAYENNKFSPSTTPYIDGLISVIVPVYNVEKYVARCIDSILSQTYTNFELILVNDCSKDNSLKVLEEYETKYKNVSVADGCPKITLINLTENVGAAEARNVGYRQAKGEYIHFLDSDDYFAPDLFQKAIDKIKKVNTELVLNFNIVCCYEEGVGDDTKNRIGTDKNWITNSYKSEGFFNATDFVSAPQWRYLAKHSYLDSCIPFFIKGMKPSDDQYFVNVVVCPLKQVYCYKGGQYNYLVNHNSLISKLNIYDFVNETCYIDVFRYTYQFYEEHDLLDKISIKNISGIDFLLSKHKDKPYCYNEIRELFKDFFEIIITHQHLYNEYDINFVQSVMQFEKYDNWELNNKIWMLNNSSFFNTKKTIKLFGFIPFLKIKKKGDKAKVYLFGFIPLLKIKN